MSNCNCKQEIAAILRDNGGPIGIVAWAKSVADRLCPQAEPVLDGWRAKCGPHTGSATMHHCKKETPWILRYDPDGKFVYEHSLWYCGGRWEPSVGDGVVTQFPTESAARAALLAASEPGVSIPKDYDFTKDEFARSVLDPAPAVAFDAEKWAERTDIASGQSLVAVALRAAHSIGDAAGYARAKAEQTPRKWPEGRTGNEGRNVLCWYEDHDGGFWYRMLAATMKDGSWWLPQPAAPAAAKEGR